MLRIPFPKFLRRRKQLEADGMPAAIRCGRELRYSREEFDLWLAHPQLGRDTLPQEEEPAVVRNWNQFLLRHYGKSQ